MEKLCKSDGTKLIYSSFALKCIFEILEHFLFARLNFNSTTFWKQIFLVTFLFDSFINYFVGLHSAFLNYFVSRQT